MSRFACAMLLALLLCPLLGCGDGGGTPGKNADQDKPKSGDVRK
jgi:hypothetical protein